MYSLKIVQHVQLEKTVKYQKDGNCCLGGKNKKGPFKKMRFPGSSAMMLESSVMPNNRPLPRTRSLLCPRYPAFFRSPDISLLGGVWSSMRSSVPDHNNLFGRTVASILSHPVCWRASL